MFSSYVFKEEDYKQILNGSTYIQPNPKILISYKV